MSVFDTGLSSAIAQGLSLGQRSGQIAYDREMRERALAQADELARQEAAWREQQAALAAQQRAFENDLALSREGRLSAGQAFDMARSQRLDQERIAEREADRRLYGGMYRDVTAQSDPAVGLDAMVGLGIYGVGGGGMMGAMAAANHAARIQAATNDITRNASPTALRDAVQAYQRHQQMQIERAQKEQQRIGLAFEQLAKTTSYRSNPEALLNAMSIEFQQFEDQFGYHPMPHLLHGNAMADIAASFAAPADPQQMPYEERLAYAQKLADEYNNLALSLGASPEFSREYASTHALSSVSESSPSNIRLLKEQASADNRDAVRASRDLYALEMRRAENDADNERRSHESIMANPLATQQERDDSRARLDAKISKMESARSEHDRFVRDLIGGGGGVTNRPKRQESAQPVSGPTDDPIDRAIDELSAELGRFPTEDEVLRRIQDGKSG